MSQAPTSVGQLLKLSCVPSRSLDLFLVDADNGVASCFVAKTGERLWMEHPGWS